MFSIIEMIRERLHLFVLLFLLVSEITAKPSCGDESMITKNGKFSKTDINDMLSTDNQVQIKMCLTVFGKDPLESGIAELLWKYLVKVR